MKIQINKKQNIFFCSDPHYHHSSLVLGTSNWENTDPCRKFNTLQEHDDKLVENINNTVGNNDILFCLGDWNFGHYKDSVRLAKEFRERINCKNIHLVLGNHDTHIQRNKEDVQNIFSSVSNYLEINVIEEPLEQGVKPFKTDVILCHYAMRVWNKSHHGSIMLYGHSHGSLDVDNRRPKFLEPTWIGDEYYVKTARTMDVGFDTHPKFRPYSWAEIQKIMSTREVILKVDHH